MNYLFTSERLGFRAWQAADIDAMQEINSDARVMEFFPDLLTKAQTIEFIERMNRQLAEKGFCYFAVDVLATKEFIGFTGLSAQHYPADFTPCIDIGWRLKSGVWNQGFATEGAKRCLEYAFEQLSIKEVYAIAPKINLKSERIMQKIGMVKQYEFEHPQLVNEERLRTFVLYKTVH
ncbi:MAG: GNAT family N-acetyltransferase [Taibaiella sp.]|nr:GNAT family N-acetyltransferase [Taibaiella sp.]